jgi:hypothetical protein
MGRFLNAFTRAEKVHAAMAVGAGVGVYAAKAAEATQNVWVQAGCYAILATLAALGVGVAKRTTA